MWLPSESNLEVWLQSAEGLSNNTSDITEGALGLSPWEALGVSSDMVLLHELRVGSNWPGQQMTATYQWELQEIWSRKGTWLSILTSDTLVG